MPGHGRMRSGHQSPVGSLSSLHKLPTPAILVFLAVLGLGLVFLLPGGLLQAQSAEQFIAYAENGEGPVARFTASDPEGATPGFWSLTAETVTDAVETADIADRALFKIDQNGVLSFKTSPNYEGRSTPYRVTVQFSDGSIGEYFKAYINVTDVEETGKITWTVTPTDGTAISELQQFQPGAELTPTVTDPDGTVTVTAWKWYRGSSVISGETEATYTVVTDDVGNRIRVEATYTDDNIGPAATVSFTSPNPVQAFRRSGDNTAPAFSPTSVTRRVEENSTGDVGGPVTATDGNGDKLTYTIAGEDVGSFKIDMATGQLMVGDDIELNYESDSSYEVMVTATDSSGTPTGTAATVAINVIDVDEKPVFATESNEDGVLNAGGVVAAQTEGRTVIDTDDNPAILEASDPDGKEVTLTLMGDDAGSFELAADEDDTNAVSQVLSFKEKTDYEMPGDRNGDNVYEVTVRASDGTMTADRELIIKVINDATEGGKVTVSPEDAVVGVELTATLTHMEGGVAASGQVTDPKWQWQTATAPTGVGVTCADDTDNNDYTTDIDDATKATYTPSDNAGDCLRAMVTYNYQFAAEVTTAASDGALILVSQTNQAPKFKEGTTTFRVVAENVEAAEDPSDDDAADNAADNVGSAIVATDANGDMPTYTLGGADASLFRIRPTGQLEVKGKLDHETDSSHTVTVTADDGSGVSNDSATIRVTIYVTDVDEEPEIKDREDSTADGMRTVPYAENGDGPVARFTASDPEGATPGFWSLTAETVTDAVETADIADRALFKIDQNGVLSFKTPPDLEEDMSVSGDDNYQVVVQASDGNNNGYFKLTVNVTDVEETGKIAWTVTPTDGTAISELQQFQPGAELTPTVTDPDGTVTVTAWKWYRGSSVISGETEATYTVVTDDVGNRIRVEATYTDDNIGPAATVSFTSPNPVQAVRPPGDNTAPAFSPTSVTRRVEENSTGDVGGPVTATDGNGDKLTYTIAGEDVGSFKIDMATGQLMVGDDIELNYESDSSYEVMVTATDSSGTPTGTAATVAINVIDVDEKPVFATESNEDGVLNAGGVVAAQTEGRTVIDTDDNPAILEASDPDGKEVTLTLMGDDAGSFELAADEDDTNAVSQVLSFKEKTDYEMPGDRNGDNVYEVTVRASDGTMTADRELIIKVINDATEGGKVTVSPEDAVVGVELTATLTHMEGGVAASGQVTDPDWQWQRARAPTDAGQTCADATGWTDIPDDATDATYTPVSADRDATATPAGGCLSAMVTYTYQFMTTMSEARSEGMAVLVSQTNQAPKFKEGTTTFRVVAENVEAAEDPSDDDAADNVGSPIVATDANGDMPTYTLGGADASLFRIRPTGQLEVKGELDHEMDSSHTVTVTANDGSGTSNDSATITVTIYVTDVDEAPEIMVRPTSLAITSGPSTTDYQEGGMGAVATYTAAGPNTASLSWSLSGDDMSAFRISNGNLMFRTAPDYENPSDMGGDNTYMVTVMASAGGETDMIDVSVTVTNVEELGMLAGESAITYMETRTDAAGTYTADGPVAARWSLSGDDADDFTIPGGMLTFAMSPSFEAPADMDMDNMYMVTVMASAGGEMDMMDVTVTVANVEEMGEVTLWAGNVALTVPPQVGDTITGLVVDDDGGITVESWQWARTMTPDMMDSWMDIDGATESAYMVTAGDTGYHLRVMATYTDAMGTDMAMESSMPTMMVGATVVVDEMGEVTLWAGNVALTMAPQVGDTITGLVVDPDGGVTGEMWQWARTMTPDMMDSWMDIQGATNAAYMVTAGDEDYHLRVTATYTDAVGTDMDTAYSMPTMMVIAADEDPPDYQVRCRQQRHDREARGHPGHQRLPLWPGG